MRLLRALLRYRRGLNRGYTGSHKLVIDSFCKVINSVLGPIFGLLGSMEFICLDPRKAKRDQINLTLSSLGNIHWLPFLLIRFSGYDESYSRAVKALEAAARPSSNSFIRLLKLQLFAQWPKLSTQPKTSDIMAWHSSTTRTSPPQFDATLTLWLIACYVDT